MSDRLDVIQFKKTQNDKTYAVRLGSAVLNRDGDGYMLYLDAMPAPVDGQFRFSIVPPREDRRPASNGSGASRSATARSRDDLDDEIPF